MRRRIERAIETESLISTITNRCEHWKRDDVYLHCVLTYHNRQ